MKRKKVILGVFLAILVISLAVNIKFAYNKMRLGDYEERQEILIATLFDLQKRGYKETDIKTIETENDDFLLKGKGEYPYKYIVYVVTKNNPDEVMSFTWADKQKTKVEMEK